MASHNPVMSSVESPDELSGKATNQWVCRFDPRGKMERKAALEHELLCTCLATLTAEPRVLPLVGGLLALYATPWLGPIAAGMWLVGAVATSTGSVAVARAALRDGAELRRHRLGVAAARGLHAAWWAGLAWLAWRAGDAHNNLFLLLFLSASLGVFVVTSAPSRLLATAQAAPIAACALHLLSRQELVPALPYVAGFVPVLFLVAHHVRSGAVRAVALRLQLAKAKAELEVANAELADLAATDELTRIANRRAFLGRATQEVARARRYGHNLCAVMIDIDAFKEVNDRYGHLAGDAVLRAVTRALCGSLRETDILARYGGDEFALLLPETPLEGACKVTERLRQTIEGLAVPVEGDLLHITMSCGVAQRLDHHRSVELLLGDADAALYRAKREGRNRVAVAD